MNIADVHVQVLLSWARVATVFAHIQFVSPLLVGILLLYPMDLLKVRFQRAALGKSFVADLAFIWADSCKATLGVLRDRL